MKNVKILNITYLYTKNNKDYCELTVKLGSFWHKKVKTLLVSSPEGNKYFYRIGTAGRRLRLPVADKANIYAIVHKAKNSLV